MADPSYGPKVYMKQGGDEQVVASGGVINVEPGGTIVADGTQAAHIADPTGGATEDAEARTAINAILVALENVGILASS